VSFSAVVLVLNLGAADLLFAQDDPTPPPDAPPATVDQEDPQAGTLPDSAMQEIPPETGGFYGTVRSTEMRPIVSATVTLPETGRMAITNGNGEYFLRDVPIGHHQVEVEYLGLTYNAEIEIKEGQLVLKHYRLDLTLAELDPIRVEAEATQASLKMREFVIRQARNAGLYFTRDDIDRIAPLQTSDLLQGSAGVRQEDRFRRRTDIGRGGGNCRPNVFVDGSPVEVFTEDDFFPEHIEAVEVYTSFVQTPLRYRITDSVCGAIIIWTRERFD
jgi:hypothetical protein